MSGQRRAIVWVLVNCNSLEEAEAIGDVVLKERQAACFDVFPRALTRYFWPPKKGKVEEAHGALLVLETLAHRMEQVQELVRARHSDELPFIGALRIEAVDPRFVSWMARELRRRPARRVRRT